MHWIRDEKRLALYLRDGMACAYCGDAVENGTQLTLDHLVPRSERGSNEPVNLVTACFRCNRNRGARDWRAFCEAVASYLDHEINPRAIVDYIELTTERDLAPFLVEAKALMARRGGYALVLQSVRQGDN
jgi:hypothetical protein